MDTLSKPNSMLRIYDRFQGGQSMKFVATKEGLPLAVVEEIVRFAMKIAERVYKTEAINGS